MPFTAQNPPFPRGGSASVTDEVSLLKSNVLLSPLSFHNYQDDQVKGDKKTKIDNIKINVC